MSWIFLSHALPARLKQGKPYYNAEDYFLDFQLAQHNKELAAMLKPSGENDPGDNALEYYAKHTAQIEVCLKKCR